MAKKVQPLKQRDRDLLNNLAWAMSVADLYRSLEKEDPNFDAEALIKSYMEDNPKFKQAFDAFGRQYKKVRKEIRRQLKPEQQGSK